MPLSWSFSHLNLVFISLCLYLSAHHFFLVSVCLARCVCLHLLLSVCWCLCLHTLRQFAISIHSLLLSVCLSAALQNHWNRWTDNHFTHNSTKWFRANSGKETQMQQEAGVRYDAGEPVKFSRHFGGQQCNKRWYLFFLKHQWYPTVQAPHCPCIASSKVWTQAKSGIPNPPDFLCSIPACFGSISRDCSHKDKNRQETERKTEKLGLCHVFLVTS